MALVTSNPFDRGLGYFADTQQRKAAFEHIFNVLNTTVDKPIPLEIFDTGHPVYAPDLFAELPPFMTSISDLQSKVFRKNTWVTQSDATTTTPSDKQEALFNGGFSASYPNGIDQDAYYQASGTFAYIEQTEIPLMLLGQTQNQTFVAYDWSASRAAGNSSLGSFSYVSTGSLLDTNTNYSADSNPYPFNITFTDAKNKGTYRVRQWIHPEKFGSAYKVSVYESKASNTDTWYIYDGDSALSDNGITSGSIGSPTYADAVALWSGWGFDPFGGVVAIGKGASGSYGSANTYVDMVKLDPTTGADLVPHNLPLWIVGYRYIGPTGQVVTSSYAVTSSHAVTSLSSSHALTASIALNALGGGGGSIFVTGSDPQKNPHEISGSFTMSFDGGTGLNISKSAADTITVSLGSAFHEFRVGDVASDDSEFGLQSINATGSDILEIHTGSRGINVWVESQSAAKADDEGKELHFDLNPIIDLGLSGNTIVSQLTASAIHAVSMSVASFTSQSTTIITSSLVTHHSQSVFSGSTIFGATQEPGDDTSVYKHQFTGSIDISGSGEFRIPSISFDYATGSNIEFNTATFTSGTFEHLTGSANTSFISFETGSFGKLMSDETQYTVEHLTIFSQSLLTGSLIISGTSDGDSTLEVYGGAIFRTSSTAEPYLEITSSANNGGDGDLEVAGTITAGTIYADEIRAVYSVTASADLAVTNITASGYISASSIVSDEISLPGNFTFDGDLLAGGDVTASRNVVANNDKNFGNFLVWGNSTGPWPLIQANWPLAYNRVGIGTSFSSYDNPFRLNVSGGLYLQGDGGETGSVTSTYTAGTMGISSSAHLTASFGHLMVGGGNFSSASLAAGGTGGSGDGFPFIGDASITGSLVVSSSGADSRTDTSIQSNNIVPLTSADWALGLPSKRWARLFMASEINYTNALQISGAGAIHVSEDDNLGNIRGKFIVNSGRGTAGQPIASFGFMGRKNVDITTGRKLTDNNHGHNIWEQDLNSSGVLVFDESGRPVPSSIITIYDNTFRSEPSGGAWLHLVHAYSSSAGVVSESAAVMGWGGAGPVFGFGTTQPSASFHITSSLTGSQTDLIRVQNDLNIPVFKMKPDGRFIMRNSASSAYETTMSVDSNNNLLINDTMKINHKEVIFKSGSQEVKSSVNPSTGQMKFEKSDGTYVAMKGSEVETKDSTGNIRTKVQSAGKEFIRSGSATDNQIEMQQNSAGAFISVSGSTPGYNIIETDGKAYWRARPRYIDYISGSNAWSIGVVNDEFRITDSLQNGGNQLFKIERTGKVVTLTEQLINEGSASIGYNGTFNAPNYPFLHSNGLYVSGSINTGTNKAGLQFSHDESLKAGLITGVESDNSNYNDLIFRTTTTPDLYISASTGYVGIQSSGSIPKTLTVGGDISASGTLYTSTIRMEDNGSTIQGVTDGEDYIKFNANMVTNIGDPSGAANETILSVDDANQKITTTKPLAVNTTTPATNMELTVAGDISASGDVYVGDDIILTSNQSAIINNTSNGQTALLNNGPGAYQGLYLSASNAYIGIDTATHRDNIPKRLTVAGEISSSGDITTEGTLYATRKSFLIPHPTKEDKQLQYASLEGPENGVYVRGTLKDDYIINLPDYWTELVDEDTITVSLTPVGKYQELYVKDFRGNQVLVGCKNPSRKLYCHYVVYGERKDIDRLEVEL